MIARTFASLLLFVLQVRSTVGQDNVVRRWASSGGGWRAMFAGVGFANVFKQAGLFTEEGSKFSAISTNSGGSWFSSQFFYSQQFYDAVINSNPDELYDFVTKWMKTYESISQNVSDQGACASQQEDLGDHELIYVIEQVCNILVSVGGDWATFIEGMLAVATSELGDTEFTNRLAKKDNHLARLNRTNLIIQSALVPNFRIRTADNITDTVVYAGPSGSEDLYSTILSAAFVVNRTYHGFLYSVPDTEGLGFTNVVDDTPVEWGWSNFEDFNLYPAEFGTTEIDNTFDDTLTAGTFRVPFGGGDATKVVDLAAVSSAAAGFASGVVGSTFYQAMSKFKTLLQEGLSNPVLVGTAFDLANIAIYENPIYDNFAVCSQWPDPCGDTDGYLIDGGMIDNTALAVNVMEYQQSKDADLSKALKIVVTNANEGKNETSYFDTGLLLQFWSNPSNENVTPGEFIWTSVVPFQSLQIFEEYLDQEMLLGMLELIDGSNITTAVIKGTTIDNAAYGIRAGQSVEVMIIQLNEPIPTFIVGQTIINATTPMLAEMVRRTATNEILVDRVQTFFFDTTQDGSSNPTTNLVDYPPSNIPSATNSTDLPDAEGGASSVQVEGEAPEPEVNSDISPDDGASQVGGVGSLGGSLDASLGNSLSGTPSSGANMPLLLHSMLVITATVAFLIAE